MLFLPRNTGLRWSSLRRLGTDPLAGLCLWGLTCQTQLIEMFSEMNMGLYKSAQHRVQAQVEANSLMKKVVH